MAKAQTKTSNADIARSYRDRYGMDMPTLKLARIMYANENLSFTSVEDARTTLRAIEGKLGKKKSVKITYGVDKERPKNPYNLPQSDETIYEPFRIDAKRLAVLSDIHIPYHSIDALPACFIGRREYTFCNGRARLQFCPN